MEIKYMKICWKKLQDQILHAKHERNSAGPKLYLTFVFGTMFFGKSYSVTKRETLHLEHLFFDLSCSYIMMQFLMLAIEKSI